MLDPRTPWSPPPALLDDWVRRVVDDGVVVAGVRPVTDTVKEVVETSSGQVVGVTHDRERLRRLVCVVAPRPVEADDLGEALATLREAHDVVLLSAPR